MTDQEKAKEEFRQKYIEYCKKRKEIESAKLPKGMLDGHMKETRKLSVNLFEEMERIKKKYNVDKIEFYYEDASKILDEFYFDK